MGKHKDKKKGKHGGGDGAKAADGVKVPKGLRKAGKAAVKLAQQPVVSEAVAAALLAAAAALRGDGAAKQGAKAAGDAAADAGAAAGKKASVLGDALKAVAIDVAKRTVEAWEESGKKARKAGGKR